MTENIKAVPKEEVAVVEKKYLKRIDPTEDEVNTILGLGYTLSGITPISQEFMKNNVYKSIDSQLVYHFILKGAAKK